MSLDNIFYKFEDVCKEHGNRITNEYLNLHWYRFRKNTAKLIAASQDSFSQTGWRNHLREFVVAMNQDSEAIQNSMDDYSGLPKTIRENVISMKYLIIGIRNYYAFMHPVYIRRSKLHSHMRDVSDKFWDAVEELTISAILVCRDPFHVHPILTLLDDINSHLFEFGVDVEIGNFAYEMGDPDETNENVLELKRAIALVHCLKSLTKIITSIYNEMMGSLDDSTIKDLKSGNLSFADSKFVLNYFTALTIFVNWDTIRLPSGLFGCTEFRHTIYEELDNMYTVSDDEYETSRDNFKHTSAF